MLNATNFLLSMHIYFLIFSIPNKSILFFPYYSKLKYHIWIDRHDGSRAESAEVAKYRQLAFNAKPHFLPSTYQCYA